MVITEDTNVAIALPQPEREGHVPLENVLGSRRSVREFEGHAMPLGELGQVLWAAQGICFPSGLRTAPSAGALYPLELYAIVAGSGELEAGIYRYLPDGHSLELRAEGDFRAEFAAAAHMQEWIAQGSLILVVAAAHGRTAAKYGERSRRYVAIEAGHAVQNICLQAVALGLGATEVGAFRDDTVAHLVRLPADQETVTTVVVGRPLSPDRS